MTKERMSFEEFKARKEEWEKARPSYFQGLESDPDGMARFSYDVFYIKKGREFAFTK